METAHRRRRQMAGWKLWTNWWWMVFVAGVMESFSESTPPIRTVQPEQFPCLRRRLATSSGGHGAEHLHFPPARPSQQCLEQRISARCSKCHQPSQKAGRPTEEAPKRSFTEGALLGCVGIEDAELVCTGTRKASERATTPCSRHQGGGRHDDGRLLTSSGCSLQTAALHQGSHPTPLGVGICYGGRTGTTGFAHETRAGENASDRANPPWRACDPASTHRCCTYFPAGDCLRPENGYLARTTGYFRLLSYPAGHFACTHTDDYIRTSRSSSPCSSGPPFQRTERPLCEAFGKAKVTASCHGSLWDRQEGGYSSGVHRDPRSIGGSCETARSGLDRRRPGRAGWDLPRVRKPGVNAMSCLRKMEFSAEADLRSPDRLEGPALRKLLGTSSSLVPLGQDGSRGVCLSAADLHLPLFVASPPCKVCTCGWIHLPSVGVVAATHTSSRSTSESLSGVGGCTVLVDPDSVAVESVCTSPPRGPILICKPPAPSWGVEGPLRCPPCFVPDPWFVGSDTALGSFSSGTLSARWSLECLMAPLPRHFALCASFQSPGFSLWVHQVLHRPLVRELSSLLAPKRRIGGSGTSASPLDSPCLQFLQALSRLVAPFFISLALLSLLTCCHAILYRPLRILPSACRPGAVLRLFAPMHALRAWDVASTGYARPPVLLWQPVKNRLPGSESEGFFSSAARCYFC